MPVLHTLFTVIKLVLYYLAYQLVFGGIFAGLSHLVVPMDMTTTVSLAMLVSTLVMAWHLIHFGYVNLAQDKYRRVTLPILGVSTVFIFTAMYVLNLLIEQAGIPNTMEDTFIDMSRNPFGILSIALLAPILEELLFRGAIQGHLQGVLKHPWVAILIASAIFGVVHMNPAQIPFAFLLGTMFGWLYYRTGSLLPGIIGHVLNNSIAAISMLLYGDATIEEQMPSATEMWGVAIVAAILFFFAARWLDRNLGVESPSQPSGSDVE